MFSAPPRTAILRLSRPLVILLFSFGALNPPPTEGADPFTPTKLQRSIPPGMDDLDSLQADYEASSKELQEHFSLIHKNAPACPNGALIATMLAKAAPAQANQRKKIVDSLNVSKLELQTEMAKLDGIGAELKQSASGTAVFEISKGLITSGAAKPLAVISTEQKKIKDHNERMQSSVAGASAALEGEAPLCQEARNIYFAKMRPLALEIPEKLKKVEASLEAHKEALNRWADSVRNNLVSGVSANANH